ATSAAAFVQTLLSTNTIPCLIKSRARERLGTRPRSTSSTSNRFRIELRVAYLSASRRARHVCACIRKLGQDPTETQENETRNGDRTDGAVARRMRRQQSASGRDGGPGAAGRKRGG